MAPWPLRIAALAGVIALLGAGALAFARIAGETDLFGRTDCDEFRFDSDAWKRRPRVENRRELAEGLVDCGTLAGKSDRDLVRLLGPPVDPHPVHYPRGWTHGAWDYAVDGDVVLTVVLTDRDRRATGAEISEVPSSD